MIGSLSPDVVQPVRRNNLVNRIARAIFNVEPDKGPQPTQQDSTLTGTTAFSVQSIFDKYFLTDVERLVIYKDVQEMDEQSEETSTALDTIADNVCSSEDGVQTSIEVKCDDAQALQVINDMLNRVDLHKKLYSIVRNNVKFGDGFNEIVVNGEADVVAIKPLPPNTIYRNEDRFGNLVLGPPKYDLASGQCLNSKDDCAFSQVDVQTQRVIAAFYPWQILHLRHNWDGMSPYGRSMLKVTRVIWRKLKAEEEGVILGRLTRAFLKLIHYVDTTGLAKPAKIAALNEYKQAMTQRQDLDGRREQQFYVLSDIYVSSANIKIGNQVVPSTTKIDTLDPKNEALQNISDMEYFHKKMLSTIRVPPAHMGFEKDINAKATLTLQDVQYVRFLRRIQQNIGHGIEQIIDTQLVLKGFDPKSVPYQIRWPRLSATDEALASLAEMQRATGDQVYLQEGIISRQFVQQTRFGFDDDAIADIEQEIQDDVQRKQAMADADAARQASVKVAQAGAIAKGRNNGGDTTRGNPPPGGRSVSHDRDHSESPERVRPGVNPPTTRAIRQEVEALIPELALAVAAVQQAASNGHDPLLEEAERAINSPIPVPVHREAQPEIHVHLEKPDKPKKPRSVKKPAEPAQT